MKKQAQKQQVSKPLLVRLTPAERARLEAAARKEQRSMAAQVRVFIERGIEQLAAA